MHNNTNNEHDEVYFERQTASGADAPMQQSPHRYRSRDVQERTPHPPQNQFHSNLLVVDSYADPGFSNGHQYHQNQFGEQNQDFCQAPPRGGSFDHYQPEEFHQVPRSYHPTAVLNMPLYHVNDPRSSLPPNYNQRVAPQYFNGGRYQHNQDVAYVPHQGFQEHPPQPQFAEPDTGFYPPQLLEAQYVQTSNAWLPSGPREPNRSAMPPPSKPLRINTNVNRVQSIRRSYSLDTSVDHKFICDSFNIPNENAHRVIRSTWKCENFLNRLKEATHASARELEKFIEEFLTVYPLGLLYTDPAANLDIYERLIEQTANVSVCCAIIAKKLLSPQELTELEKKRKYMNKIVQNHRNGTFTLTYESFAWFQQKIMELVVTFHFVYWRSEKSVNGTKNWAFPTYQPSNQSAVKRGIKRATRSMRIKGEVLVDEQSDEDQQDDEEI